MLMIYMLRGRSSIASRPSRYARPQTSARVRLDSPRKVQHCKQAVLSKATHLYTGQIGLHGVGVDAAVTGANAERCPTVGA